MGDEIDSIGISSIIFKFGEHTSVYQSAMITNILICENVVLAQILYAVLPRLID